MHLCQFIFHIALAQLFFLMCLSSRTIKGTVQETTVEDTEARYAKLENLTLLLSL